MWFNFIGGDSMNFMVTSLKWAKRLIVFIIMTVLCFIIYISIKDSHGGALEWLFGKEPPSWDFQPTDTIFMERLDYPEDFVAVCKVDKEGKIEGCWLVDWEDTKKCLQDSVKPRPQPTPIPPYEPMKGDALPGYLKPKE